MIKLILLFSILNNFNKVQNIFLHFIKFLYCIIYSIFVYPRILLQINCCELKYIFNTNVLKTNFFLFFIFYLHNRIIHFQNFLKFLLKFFNLLILFYQRCAVLLAELRSILFLVLLVILVLLVL